MHRGVIEHLDCFRGRWLIAAPKKMIKNRIHSNGTEVGQLEKPRSFT
jgi:hypothetical protein